MTTRLDPRRPLLWRTPHSLQVGVDEAVVLDSVRTETEQVVAALRAGFPALVERRLADAFDIPAHEIHRVLSTLDAVIEHGDPTSGHAVTHRVAVDGASLAAELLRRLLSEQEAVELLPPESGSTGAGSQPGRVDVAVLVADFVIPPSRYTRWLRDDVPHLPVVFSDRVVRIGPFVTPGSGPCLHCVELHRTDDDPAWPAVASQLLGHRSPLDTQLLGAEVATRVTRLVLRHLDASQPILASTQLVVDAATGGVRRRVVREHSRCACRALPGIATARVDHRVAASRTRTG
ncbi:TOMM precursor leader peptide-binding protein [Plantibacter sp. CFBP 8798]|uniref:TOMM precursor leader peptide-binding protein n=1 Tax=Plantibacter sp. CFBP 8798 TaxID=2775268 RepID=UPI00178677D0|nr:TOMM precursor leader peptide-binding protein [Plantibacter sp. CFBP 8798]MBD8466841.1 TOMM precursor leader peptide-binding protein [Plantibacter sp. CFBP 8798]